MAVDVVVVPGIGNSGAEHWQSRWQRAGSTWSRIVAPSWAKPVLDDWVHALAEAATPGCLIVAHSLGALTTAAWLAGGGTAAGAFLVAPPDPRGPGFPVEADGFEGTPAQRLPIPTLVVSSSNDPYDPASYAVRMAASWGAGHIDVGPLGHVNVASGIGDWPEGRRLLGAYAAGRGLSVEQR